VLKDYGERTSNSIVASICALNVTEESSPDYGYVPRSPPGSIEWRSSW